MDSGKVLAGTRLFQMIILQTSLAPGAARAPPSDHTPAFPQKTGTLSL